MSIRQNQGAYQTVRKQADKSGDQFLRTLSRSEAYKKDVKSLREEQIDIRNAIAFAEDRTAMIEWAQQVEEARRSSMRSEIRAKDDAVSAYQKLRNLVYELAVAEIEQGGFYAHVTGASGQVKPDAESRRLELRKKGRYAVPFAAPMSSFSDTTNIKILSLKGE